MQGRLYSLVFSGEVCPDADIETVKATLAGMMKLDATKVSLLFSGKPVKVKNRVDHDTAMKYVAAFRKAGAILQVVLLDGGDGRKKDTEIPQESSSTVPEPREEDVRAATGDRFTPTPIDISGDDLKKAGKMLSDADILLMDDKPNEGIAKIEECLALYPGFWKAHHDMASACLSVLDKSPDMEPVKRKKMLEKALVHAEKAFGQKGLDVHVARTMADALAADGRSSDGLAVLERCFHKAQTEKLKKTFEKNLEKYRTCHGLGNIWAFFDPWSRKKVLFETNDSGEVRKKLLSGELPRDALCMKNRVGDIKPLEEYIACDEKDVKLLFFPIRYHLEQGAAVGFAVAGAVGAIHGGWWYLSRVIAGIPGTWHDLYRSFGLIMILALLVFMGPITLAFCLILLALCMAVGGFIYGIPGAILIGSIGAIVGIIRLPWLPRLPKPEEE